MFREMRRKKQALLFEECAEILKKGASGVLAVSGDVGYPYAVPLSYAYDGAKIYFHCAKCGHKLDSIQRNSKVSFCVIGQDRVVPEKYTTCFKSVIAFGTIRVLEDESDKRRAIEKLALKYAPKDTEKNRRNTIDRAWESLCTLELTIEHMTGKACIELTKKRERFGNIIRKI